jgi:MerR family transcriptional regulator/heat shock protein HspR
LAPFRTEGGTRRYSGDDLEQIHEITTLLGAGLNLAGIVHVFRLRDENHQLRVELDRHRSRSGPRKSATKRQGDE